MRWVESVQWMATAGGIEMFLEIGPGAVLGGLIKRIVPGVAVASLSEPEALSAAIAAATT